MLPCTADGTGRAAVPKGLAGGRVGTPNLELPRGRGAACAAGGNAVGSLHHETQISITDVQSQTAHLTSKVELRERDTPNPGFVRQTRSPVWLPAVEIPQIMFIAITSNQAESTTRALEPSPACSGRVILVCAQNALKQVIRRLVGLSIILHRNWLDCRIRTSSEVSQLDKRPTLV